jgi:hypothetical protein
LLAAPLVGHGLPDYESHLGEEYQPLKALKFFHSRGREFHKWGPADNFLYAPGYALSLFYWKHEGTFGPASPSFPYGFHRPLQQLTTLILQSRILLVCFVLLSLALLGANLVAAGFSRLATFFALFLCAASNPVLIWQAVILKGDGPMIAFSSLALGTYVLIARRGITMVRALWLTTFIAWAVTSKESAVPLFALPCLGLVFEGLRRSHPPELRASIRRAVAVGLIALVGWYALLNVIYAPSTWLRRMHHLTVGNDPAIWGGPDRSASDYVREIMLALTDNLGPGGMLAAVASIALVLALRPKGSWSVAAPFASYLLLGLLPVGYVPDRFALPAALGLVPLVACAIDALLQRIPSWVHRLSTVLAVLTGVNLLYANIAWLRLRSRPEDLIEAYVQANLRRDELFSIFSFWPRIPGKSRLEVLGYQLDPRPIAKVVRSKHDLPKTVLIDSDLERWIEDFTRRPKRAEMVAEETGFQAADWQSFKALGYRLTDRLSSPLPGWYPFGWMPLASESNARTVLVYRLD